MHDDNQNGADKQIVKQVRCFINNQIGALSHTKRISEIRAKLKPYLLDVVAERIHGHVYLNKIK